MRTLLVAGALLACHGGARSADVEPIEPDPEGGTSAAVKVSASVPLVHTEQVLVDGTGGTPREQAQAAARRLEAILKKAGSSPDRIVKLNFVVTEDGHRERLREELARGTFGKGKPAVSFVRGNLPGGSAWAAVDAVAAGSPGPDGKGVAHQEGSATMPPGTRIYISGQAVKGKDLAEATRKTLEELHTTVCFLAAKESAVVQVKAFLQPMAEHGAVREEVKKFFEAAGAKVPPLVLVEWQSSLPVEIELIVWGGPARAGEVIDYLTPPGLTASPVFSRVARINRGDLIYLSGLYGSSDDDPAAEIPQIFGQMGKILAKAGSDFGHLAKATYYVTSPPATRKMGEIRPSYYDPTRPPAASLALVRGTGRPKRTVTMDMIAVPRP